MQLLFSCRDIAITKFVEQLQEIRTPLADTIFKHADNAANNDLQRSYFEARQVLLAHWGDVEDAFKEHFNEYFQYQFALISRVSAKEVRANQLSLVDNESLEDEIALSAIIAKAGALNKKVLWQLNCRLSSLQEELSLDDNSNPFGPEQVFNALRRAFKQLDLEMQSRLLVYKELGKLFSPCFEPTLHEVNDFLVTHKILPELAPLVLKNKTVEKKVEPSAAELEPSDQKLDEKVNKQNPTVVEKTAPTIDQVLAQEREVYSDVKIAYKAVKKTNKTAGGVSFGRFDRGGVAGAQDTVSTVSLAQVLSSFQREELNQDSLKEKHNVAPDTVESYLFDRLEEHASDLQQHKITEGDTETIDILGLIFRYILDDERIPNQVALLLSHLYTPYLKLALIDKSFLENERHPARSLLNGMAEIGAQWVKTKNDRLVMPKLREFVMTILDDFETDISLFDEVYANFLKFEENLKRRANNSEQRIIEAQKGKEKLEEAKALAKQECQKRLHARNSSEQIQYILLNPWSDFLTNILLRYGIDSTTWQSALKVFDGVVWSVQPDRQFSSPDDFRRRQKAFAKSVEKGLESIGYDKKLSENLHVSLQKAQQVAYLKAHKKDKQIKRTIQANDEVIELPIRSEEVIPPKLAEQGLNADEKKAHEMLAKLEFGTWFEFELNTRNPLRLKLAWYSQVTSRYMFVNAAGVKQRVDNRRDLAIAMAAGYIRIAEPEKDSFMGRALTRVLETFKMMSV